MTIVISVISVNFILESESYIGDGICNVAVFPIEGVILPYNGLADFDLVTTPESFESFIASAEEQPGIEAMLIEVNSPGGTPVASERIAERIRQSELPIIGMIGDQGASGGYMIAAATDHLVASPMSDVGSIGVNMSYLEESEKNEEEGLTYVQLTTGKFKDTGTPNRPITDEERELLMSDLNIVNDRFIDMVSEYRELDREAVVALADGSTMPGTRALENKLIDTLGGREEVRDVIARKLEIANGDVVFCEYERNLLPF